MPLTQEKYEELSREIEQLSPRELKNLKNMIDDLAHQRQEDRIEQQIKLNEVYVNKYYRRIPVFDLHEKYYKIISAQATSEYKVAALAFTDIPILTFHTNYSLNPELSYNSCGKWELNSFTIENLLIESLSNKDLYEEIDERVWNEAVKKHIEGLKAIC